MVDSNAVMVLQLYICLNTKHLYQGVTYFFSKGYVTFDTTFKEFLGLWTCFLELYLNAEGRRGRGGGGGGGGDVSQWPPLLLHITTSRTVLVSIHNTVTNLI